MALGNSDMKFLCGTLILLSNIFATTILKFGVTGSKNIRLAPWRNIYDHSLRQMPLLSTGAAHKAEKR